MRTEQSGGNNVEVTELINVRLNLFYVLVPTKCSVLLDGKSFIYFDGSKKS